MSWPSQTIRKFEWTLSFNRKRPITAWAGGREICSAADAPSELRESPLPLLSPLRFLNNSSEAEFFFYSFWNLLKIIFAHPDGVQSGAPSAFFISGVNLSSFPKQAPFMHLLCSNNIQNILRYSRGNSLKFTLPVSRAIVFEYRHCIYRACSLNFSNLEQFSNTFLFYCVPRPCYHWVLSL